MDLLHPASFDMNAGRTGSSSWTDIGPQTSGSGSSGSDSNEAGAESWSSRSPYSSRPSSFHPSPVTGYADGPAPGSQCKIEPGDDSCPQLDSHANAFEARLGSTSTRGASVDGNGAATRDTSIVLSHSGTPGTRSVQLPQANSSHRADPGELARAFGRLPFESSLSMDVSMLVAPHSDAPSQGHAAGEAEGVPSDALHSKTNGAGWTSADLAPSTPGDDGSASRRQSQQGSSAVLDSTTTDFFSVAQNAPSSASPRCFASSRDQPAEDPSSSSNAASASEPSMALYSTTPQLYENPGVPSRHAYVSPGLSPSAGSYVDLPPPAGGLPPLPRVPSHSGFASGLTSADDMQMIRRDSAASEHLPSRPGSAFSSAEAGSYHHNGVWSSVPASRHSSLASSPSSHYHEVVPRNILGYGHDPRTSAALAAGNERQQIETLLAPYIRQYVSTPNKFLLGERTVLVMSGKVAQKSYGTEKRFLCPPPAALLLGCSWWSAAPAESEPFQLEAPTTVISMISERGPPNEAYSEWMTMSGRVASSRASLGDAPIAGRCVGKQLHISEVDEKTKRVKSLVRVFAPGYGAPETRIIGSFPSKSIKVISKPSKKRSSVKNVELCIHHGTTVSLFNRLRSQTVSTKYLCISGPPASFPAEDWKTMTGQVDRPFAQGEDSTCFVARTSAWDPFIIYVVDPTKVASTAQPTPQSGYPRPPANALPVPARGGPLPVFYNQPIVLQCLSTGVVSPIMVIRKVEKGAMAFGGLSADAYASPSSGRHPVAPGECVGDMVSSLHKIALEVLSDPQEAYGSGISALQGFPGSGSFLACLGENVGVNAAHGPRQASNEFANAPGGRLATANAVAEHEYLTSGASGSRVPSSSRRTGERLSPDEAEFSSDGGKVRRSGRKGSSMTDVFSARPRSRGGSLPYDDSSSVEGDDPAPKSWGTAQSRAWQVECGEPAVWTIVGCEIERHSFYIPPVLIGGYNPSPITPGTVSEVFTTPTPRSPIGLGTSSPIPQLHRYLANSLMDRRDQRAGEWITVCGTDLSPQLWVWFGEHASPAVEFKSTECMAAQVPPQLYGQPHTNQILLVRGDGVIFGSQLTYPSL